MTMTLDLSSQTIRQKSLNVPGSGPRKPRVDFSTSSTQINLNFVEVKKNATKFTQASLKDQNTRLQQQVAWRIRNGHFRYYGFGRMINFSEKIRTNTEC